MRGSIDNTLGKNQSLLGGVLRSEKRQAAGGYLDRADIVPSWERFVKGKLMSAGSMEEGTQSM